MKSNNYPTPRFLLLYILVFMVVLPSAAPGLTIIPNDMEMMVMPLVLFFFLLAALLLVRIIKKHNRQVARKLQLLEEQYLQPGCPEDALLAISGIIGVLKAKTGKRTRRSARLSSSKRRQYEEMRIKINENLETFANSTNGFIDFLKTRNSDHTGEIKRLYAGTHALLSKVKENLPTDEQQLLLPPLGAVIWFIRKEFPDLVDKEDKPSTWESLKEIDKTLHEPAGFPDLAKLLSNLEKKVMEEPDEDYINVKTGTGSIREQIGELEASLSRILSIEYNQKISMDTKLDEYSVEFYTLKKESRSYLAKVYRGEAGKEIQAGVEKIEKIINFIILDYRKYTRITVGLEKLNERFSSVLETQDRYLTRKQKALENTMTSLEETIRKSAQEAASEIQLELSGRLDSRDENQRMRAREMQKMSDMLRDSLKTSINNLDQETSKILMDQEQRLEERNKRIQEIIQETLKRVMEKLEIEYSTVGNKLDEKINQKVDQLDNVLLSAAAKIEKPTASAVEKFKGSFAILLEQQTGLVEKQKEAAAKMQDDTDSTLEKFKTDFAALLDRQKDIFEKQNNNLREILFEMQNNADSYVEKYKKDFAVLFDQQSGLLEKQKKVVDEMQNDADVNVEKFKKDFTGLLGQQQDLLKKQEETAAEMQSDADSTMEKFKTGLSKVVEDHNKNLKVYSGSIENSVSRLGKMPWFSDDSEKLGALINYINKNLYLNISARDALEVIKRIEGEPGFSEKYRKCAVALFDDLLVLEKSHKDKWYWRFLESIKSKLEDSIIPFYNRKGKTIYDSYFKEEVDLQGLKNVSEDKLRQIINKQHWGQIWEPLLRWVGFLKVYFGETLEDLWTVLNYSARNAVEVLENSLGYRVDPYKPMQIINEDLVKDGTVKEAVEHVTFYREIMHHIKTNEKINAAQERLNQDTGSKMIVYVDRLGLVDNGERICESRLIFYSPVIMKSVD
ncbi:MAG: hypothetical protein GTO45_32845 [Candidatus Aminicenantes bacterium]|nr:hypothetical protein [Candidatus Aminicenantes bacterium]NIM83537.1 hypothetical protein [Candidatus Aminicenantes bacterium]NIN22926.1 hypothetical protein [Candidatus Aminicenantes bacterium]NIN46665.1 hypothetical protein [Candidatus Aminicenantes bacterium]NIN89571.1 hypothetical protein [Candidatus Aminicenantes bacterium]